MALIPLVLGGMAVYGVLATATGAASLSEIKGILRRKPSLDP